MRFATATTHEGFAQSDRRRFLANDRLKGNKSCFCLNSSACRQSIFAQCDDEIVNHADFFTVGVSPRPIPVGAWKSSYPPFGPRRRRRRSVNGSRRRAIDRSETERFAHAADKESRATAKPSRLLRSTYVKNDAISENEEDGRSNRRKTWESDGMTSERAVRKPSGSYRRSRQVKPIG